MTKMARWLSISQSTLKAVSVLCVAIATSMAWNVWEGAPLFSWSKSNDPSIGRFLQRVCGDDEDDVYCHPALVHKRRTQMAIRKIHRGERILEIPRSLQIWDLDALRDSQWVRPHVMGAKHPRTGNPVDSAAYLALYLALLAKGRVELPTTTETAAADSDRQTDQSPSVGKSRLLQYLTECMPSHEELSHFHPILWNETEIKELLPLHSASFAVAKAYRDMVNSEYQAFTDTVKQRTSELLEDVVSKQDYQTFRILVLSRSFGTGPLPVYNSQQQSTANKNQFASDSSLSREELDFYLDEFGIDLNRGSYAMVPILDFYDHHARPNVEYSYSRDKRVFAIKATNDGIATGHEVVDSYGKYTDAHLFAKFGFVNGDGSGYSQANLATQHMVLDLDLKQQFSYLPFLKSQPLSEGIKRGLERQKQGVMQYLRFDDGYQDCVFLEDNNSDDEGSSSNDDRPHPKAAYELKKLKLKHLARIANHSKRWHLVLLPRAPESLPARASNVPITTNPPKISKRNTKFFHRKEYQLIAATCRLISLTHEDYDGNAVQVLRRNLRNSSFLVEPQIAEDSAASDRESNAGALEFRTHFCLARLVSEALKRFDTTIADMEDKVTKLNRNSFQTKEWTAAHLTLSEMQALEVLRGVSFTAARVYEDLRNQSPAFFIRDSPCPVPE